MAKDGPPLWQRLYMLVWLIFFEIILLMFFGGDRLPLAAHTLLGIAVFALAMVNARALANSAAPARTKRVAAVIPRMAGAQLVLGAALGFGVNLNLGLSLVGIFGVLHITIALAMITQASSVATSYDMWEEREYETAPQPSASAESKVATATPSG